MVVEIQNLDAEEMRKLMMVLLLLLKSNANFFQASAIYLGPQFPAFIHR
jgi:hypothetical protein